MRMTLMAAVILAAAPLFAGATTETPTMLDKFRAFVRDHQARIAPMERAANLAWWEAATTGNDDAYKRESEFRTKLETVYTDPTAFAFLKEIKASGVVTDPLEKRLLEHLYLAYLGHQIEPGLLAKVIAASSAIEQKFSTFRGRVGLKEVTDNQIEEVLTSSRIRDERKTYWLASKQVGAALAADVVGLVKLRNEAAVKLGSRDFYALQLTLGEQDEAWLLGLFDQLAALTAASFTEAKARIDGVQAGRLGVPVAELMPWDYTDRFFQEGPNLSDVDMDAPVAGKDIGKLVASFYRGIGLDAEPILAKSDLYEHKGKNPHAFSQDIDRNGDVRALLNIKPNQTWLGTTLHEIGHGVYAYNVSRSLPYLLRSENSTFATEGVAMMMEGLAENAAFYRAMALTDEGAAAKLAAPMAEKERMQGLIFSRWSQVMLRFEKELYANPGQDLDALWWKLVERYQGLKRPAEAPRGAWASKIHIVTVPVYYHNYQLGAIYAAQLHAAICRDLYPGQDPSLVVYVGNPKVGSYLKEKVFAPGASLTWQEFVVESTGEPLSAKAFSAQFVAAKAASGGAKP
ncbi:MAG: M2 family metallopeptidase [Acidobacteriia bacterium]|nr:M2 family metallopeptidase [Terriglobia bacterium]